MSALSIVLLRLLAEMDLRRRIGPSRAAATSGWIRDHGPREMARLKALTNGLAHDVRGRVLLGAFLHSAVLYGALRAAVEPAQADSAFRGILHRFLRPLFRVAMRPLPAGVGAFATFKRRYLKANRPLTLMTWRAAVDEPAAFGVDFTACGLAAAAKAIGSPALCTFYCEFDKVFFADYDARLVFSRDRTLAAGADRCTFRFVWRSDASRGRRRSPRP